MLANRALRSETRTLWSGVLTFSFALALMVPGCSKPDESRQVADRFMTIYYVQMNVADAVKLCGGAAKTKLEGELQALQGVAPDAASGKPSVGFSLASEAQTSPTQATYAYNVNARTSDVGKIVASLTLANDGGHWLVTTFDEKEGAPTS
ncbi:MAG: hypothetical protein HYR72_00820 [Deltaproteobacteria bacterium]|nr:hypothetical protein [Deltaproteobacteria bacterium]MBI3391282.1 hypothetical protein [Deltaproteobacteria bacterium]